MTFGEVMESLRARGFRVTMSTVRYALDAGLVSRPDKDRSGRYLWTEYNVDQLADYLDKRR